ncbi:MAG: cytochrome c oxidase accessory protein CcoG [Kofleriaceae bacterium]|nr:cytochrome c oxidase accessory protein CcoG [Kofleriaceae bacterium]
MQPITDRVLSTLNADGSRHYMRPRLAHGRFLTRRRIVGYALIALFVLLPRIRIDGRPGLLIDLGARELSAFGAVFRPTDGFMLALLGIAIAVTVFLVTALWGRVWCGWGCPQTVYLELVFRPIERWLEGPRGQKATLPRRVLKWTLFAALAFALANVFLAYFVGTDRLEAWVFGSPLAHPVGFGIVVGVSALMLFDFGWFREQMCIVTCPYGRLQSVLLDRQSSIVGYDATRGEPRGKAHKSLPVVRQGDCVDCGACTQVCPTGIDIRNGLQMECIGCTQCIDACDAVMDKLNRPRGLIRYTSQDELAGKPAKLWRARTIAYPAILAIALTGLVLGISGRATTEVTVDRITGATFVELPDGKVSAQARLKVENREDVAHRYHLSLVGAPDATLRSQVSFQLAARARLELPVFIDVPRASFTGGKRRVQLRVDDSAGFERIVEVVLLGPEGGTP